MDNILSEHSLSDMEFYEYRLMMIEEAENILTNKKFYIQDDFLPPSAKIMKIADLIDFFTVEGEDAIVRDLRYMEDSIRIRIFIKGNSNSASLYH